MEGGWGTVFTPFFAPFRLLKHTPLPLQYAAREGNYLQIDFGGTKQGKPAQSMGDRLPGVLRIVMFEQEGKEEHGCRANTQDHVGVDERHGGGLRHERLIDLGHDGRLRSKRPQSGAAGVQRHGIQVVVDQGGVAAAWLSAHGKP